MRSSSKGYAAPVLLIAALGLGSCRSPEPAPTLPPRPYNVVLIVIDTLRADHLGAYGHTRDTSPYIDSLAASGIVFEHATSPSSFTGISIASLISGRIPSRAGIRGLVPSPPADSTTMAERLKSVGYQTALATRHPLIGVGRFTAGFDRSKIVETNDAELSTTALEFADTFDDRPFFLYAHYFAPHAPYEPPDEFYAKFSDNPPAERISRKDFRHNYEANIAAGHVPGNPAFDDMVVRYDAEIAYTDRCVKTLMKGLRERGLLENTIVILTADHGDEFFEHGYIGHAWTLYEEVTHVPLILWSESLFDPARVSDRVSLLDVVPTLWTLLGVNAGADPLDGAPFMTDFDGRWRPDVTPRFQVAELHIPERVTVRSITLGDWKYIATSRWKEPAEREEARQQHDQLQAAMEEGTIPTPGAWDPPEREELFNLREDSTEKFNLVSTNEVELAELRQTIEALRPAPDDGTVTTKPGSTALTPEERARLEALGYL